MIAGNDSEKQNTDGDSLAALLSRMNTAIDGIKEVDITPEVSTEIVPEVTHSNHWYKGMKSPNPAGRPSRKPLTDALMEILPPVELARIIAEHAKKGKDWAVRLAAMYTQTPEMLNRLGGEDVGEPIRIEQLAKQAQEMGLDIKEVIAEGERALTQAWEGDSNGAEGLSETILPREQGENTGKETPEP